MSVENLSKIDGLDVVQGVKNCMDDESLFLSIVEMFVTQLNQNVTELQQQHDAGEWITYGKTCHGIKGAAASVGAVAIQTFSAELESAGKTEDSATIQAKNSDYLALLNSTCDAINAAT